MKIDNNKLKIIIWIIRIISIVVILFSLLFYFGYGNPLPFFNDNFTFWDNMWAFVFPLIFIGLIVGLKWEKIGGYFILIPTIISSLIGLIFLKENLPGPILVPIFIGIIYLLIGYKKSKL